jgi:hypothetical protein
MAPMSIYPSALVIRRKGVLPENGVLSNEGIVRDARDKAYKLSALLSIVLLAESAYPPKTCTLAEQVPIASSSLAASVLSPDKGIAIIRGRHSWGLLNQDTSEPIELSREKLQAILFHSRFVALSEVLARQGTTLDNSHVTTILRAALSLADAINAATVSTQLLGAVTALEILLADTYDKYASIERRLKSLLGLADSKKYDAKSIFDARHDYVHAGDRLEMSSVPMRAIGLAISALARYAEAAKEFPHKQAVMDYLDFIDKADRVSYVWRKEEQDAFNKLLRHKREAYDYPWQASYYVLNTQPSKVT